LHKQDINKYIIHNTIHYLLLQHYWQMHQLLLFFILIKDILLCFNFHNTTNSLFCQEHNHSIWYCYFFFILIKDILLCFNFHNTANSLFCQEHNHSIWYWYLIIATCFGPSLDHPQANAHRWKVQWVRTTYHGIPYYLQGVCKSN